MLLPLGGCVSCWVATIARTAPWPPLGCDGERGEWGGAARCGAAPARRVCFFSCRTATVVCRRRRGVTAGGRQRSAVAPRLYRHRFVHCARSHVRRSASGADGHPNPYRGTGNTRAAEKTKKNHPPRPGGHVARSPSTWRPQGPQNAPLRSRREALSAFSTHCGWSMLRRSRRSGWVSSRHAPWRALLWHDDPGISQRYTRATQATHIRTSIAPPPKRPFADRFRDPRIYRKPGVRRGA